MSWEVEVIFGGRIRSLEKIERDAIKIACEHERWALRRVARALGIGPSTLYRKLKRYGIEIPAPERRRPRSRAARLAYP